MFPFAPSGFVLDQHVSSHTEDQSTRLAVQRNHLEHKKMYHLNTMVVEQFHSSLDRDMVARRRLALATEGQLSIVSRLRQRIASVLISSGERIWQETPTGEPRFNA
jgi:hypothetical protein